MINKKKLIIGTANFFKSYGHHKSKVEKSEIIKILNFSKKNKISIIDISTIYKSDQKIYNYFNFKNWSFSFKISKKKNKKLNDEKVFRKYLKFKLEQTNKKKIEYFFFHNVKDLNTPWGKEIYKILLKFKGEGLIDKIGVSIYDQFELKYVLKYFKIHVVQLPINIFDQRFLDKNLIKKLKKNKVEIHARSIFLQGSLLKNYKNLNKFKEYVKFRNFLKNYKMKAINACLEFIFNIKSIDKIIIGIRSKEELKQILNSKITKNYKIYRSFKSNKKNIIDPRTW